MELVQLEYFCETARREHITQTARALNITQPALSKVIARLEGDLGVQLFDREGKNIRLNEYGQVALRYAEQILYTMGDMRAELEEMASGRAGSVRLGSSYSAREPNWVLDRVRTFMLDRPDVSFHVQQYKMTQLRSALENREIDLAVSTMPLQGSGMAWKELFVEPMGIILSAHHPLASRAELSLADLSSERFYCNNANSDLQELTHQFCAMAGFQPNIHFESDFPSFIGEAVSLGHGISLISERGHRQSRRQALPEHWAWDRNIVYRPLKDSYCRRVCGVAYLKERQLTRAVRAFYAHLVAAFDGGAE